MLVIGPIYKTELWFLTQGPCSLDKEGLLYLPQSFQPLLPSCLEHILFTPATLNGSQLVPFLLWLVTTTVVLHGGAGVLSPQGWVVSTEQGYVRQPFQTNNSHAQWQLLVSAAGIRTHITKAHTSSLRAVASHTLPSPQPSAPPAMLTLKLNLTGSYSWTSGHVLFYLTSSQIIFHV